MQHIRTLANESTFIELIVGKEFPRYSERTSCTSFHLSVPSFLLLENTFMTSKDNRADTKLATKDRTVHMLYIRIELVSVLEKDLWGAVKLLTPELKPAITDEKTLNHQEKTSVAHANQTTHIQVIVCQRNLTVTTFEQIQS